MTSQNTSAKITLLSFFFFFSLHAFTQNLKKDVDNDVSQNWFANIQSDLEKREYNISFDASSHSYQSPNRVNNLRAHYNPGQLSLQNRVDSVGHNWNCTIKTEGVFTEREKYLPQSKSPIMVNDNIIEFAYTDFTEQYINTQEGTRQNFIINKAPLNTNQIVISLAIEGLEVNKVSDNELHMYQNVAGKKEVRLVYKDLKSWDANNNMLSGTISFQDGLIKLTINTKGAVFPITVDPVYATYEQILSRGQAYAKLGISVSSAGDVNGDGYDDVIIGATSYDNGQSNEGAAFVYHGSSTGLSTTASNLLESNQVDAEMGISVSTAGDINGDGYSDVIVGAQSYDNGQSNEGVAFVYLGSSTGLSNIAADTLECDQASANMGISVSSAGDVNGDGYSDVIVGANFWNSSSIYEGAAFVYHGSSTGLSSTAAVILKINQGSIRMGTSVSTAGDVNGDGYDDVIVGAPFYDNGQTNEGGAFVFYGSSIGLNNIAGDTLEGNVAEAWMGMSVSLAGDINNDGYSDVLVGSPRYSNGQSAEGAAFVYYGSDTGINKTTLDILEGNQNDVRMGISVSSAGDVNGDGYSDVVVGADQYNNGQPDEGIAFVYHGSSTGLNTTAYSQLECNQSAARMGISVSSAGDINGDGFSDVIVGADKFNNRYTQEGAVFIYYGFSSGLGEVAAYTNLEQNQAGAQMGTSVSSAGDVNGDGYSDVIVGASKYDNGHTDEGAAFMYHGSSTGLKSTASSQLECNQSNAAMGCSVSTAGDVNGDGYSDIIVGAYYYSNGQYREGAMFVYYGSDTGVNSSANDTLESNQANAQLGTSLSIAGDVNGDGYSDVIVAAELYDNGSFNEGVALVCYGSSAGLNTIDMDTLESNQVQAYFGSSASSAGDVNGDGFSDVIVGAYGYDNGQTQEGAAFVYHGSSTGLITVAHDTIESNQVDAWMGNSVSSAGDVNGDGYGDVIVGDYRYDNGQTNEGVAFVYYGSSSGLITTESDTLECNQAEAYFGISVSSAGDVNGDGYSDVIIGAYLYDNGQTDEGAVFMYLGSANGLSNTASRHFECDQLGAQMGRSISSAGDVNGDGFADIIIGVLLFDDDQTDEGAAFVYHGAANGLRTSASHVLERNISFAAMGYAVSSAGDVNGDGYSDVIVGAPYFTNGESYEGAAFVYLGSSSGLNTSVHSQLESNQDVALLGQSISSAGDVNGDGYGDIIVGAPSYDNGQSNEGAAFVYLGSSTGLINTAEDTLEGNQVGSNFGNSVSTAGDVNGDGYSDVIVGASYYMNGDTIEGAVFIFYGSDTGLSNIARDTFESNRAYAQMGNSVSSAGDINGDGYSDVIVGAFKYENGETKEGAVFIFYGSLSGLNYNDVDTIENNIQYAEMGISVSSAGDINGDGYSDVIVGSNYSAAGGAAYVYLGSPTGLIKSASSILELNQSQAKFGASVSSAGDVNGDGYSDVLVGAINYTNGEYNEGGAFIYHGSSTGLNQSELPTDTLERNRGYSKFGGAVCSTGDINGDGFSDVIIGDMDYANGQTNEGAAFVYYGNNGSGTRSNLKLYDDNLTSVFSDSSFSDANMGIGLFAKSSNGRQKGKIVYETLAVGDTFSSGSPITNSTQFTGQANGYSDLGIEGKELKLSIAKESGPTRVRARVKYDPVTAINGQVYGPWKYILINPQMSSIGALPVELTYFTVNKQNENTALLKWQTASEMNNKVFEVERQIQGTHDYEKVGEVAGAGNSLNLLDYEFSDDISEIFGRICYRIKQIDYDNVFEYSETRCISKLRTEEVLIYPNPAKNVLNIELSDKQTFYTIQIVSLNGQVVKDLHTATTTQVDLSNIETGIYFVKLQTMQGNVIAHKLIIQ